VPHLIETGQLQSDLRHTGARAVLAVDDDQLIV
jgi:hypothetical protein